MGAEQPGHREGVLWEDLREVLKQVARVQSTVVVQVQLCDEAGHLVQQHDLLWKKVRMKKQPGRELPYIRQITNMEDNTGLQILHQRLKKRLLPL